MADIRLNEVVKSYGDLNIIKCLDLEIRDKEFMVLVGPSGCGKSTTLRMIAGLEDITDGTLSIGDRVVNDVHPKDRDVAMVFQNYALYPHMTVRQNISFGLRLRKLSPNEITHLVNEVADTLGLKELLDRKPKALSGGQCQRVALGRAIVRKPSVFLFDEPLSNLDAELRVQMRAEIGRLQKHLGITAVYVTHDQVEAMTMGDRIAVLQNGDLRQVGSPLELYNTPANVFVAQFIGTPNMNIMEMYVSETGDSLERSDAKIPVPKKWKEKLLAYGGKTVKVGFRPEHVHPADEHVWSEVLAMHGKIQIIETLGNEIVAHLAVAGLPEQLIAKMDASKSPVLGDDLTVEVNTQHLHLFDVETGNRL